MTPSGQTICLCMIVKDEAPVIRRCLESVRPLIDTWLIVDTGSTDGTQEIVRDALRGLAGELVERPWRDFAHNRSEALALARPLGDYSLIIDADDTMVVPDAFRLPELDLDSYTVDIDFGAIRYSRPQLVKAVLGWRYEGVIHEYLACEAAKTSGHLPLVMRIHQDGARRRDPETYKKDAAVLERAVAEETDPFRLSRYTFYLAQSYRDSGQSEKALALYLERADMGFWEQEIYCSLLNAGRLKQALSHEPDAILATYARATGICPLRAEALHAASRFCRDLRRFAEGHDLARRAMDLSLPAGGLFVETWIYDYGVLDEATVNAYWAGRYRDSLDAGLRALKGGKVPATEVPRFLDNLRFALDRLPPEPDAPAGPSIEPLVTAAILPTSINLGSGKDFRADCLNLDIDETWRPDLVLDLSAIDLGSEGIDITTHRFGRAMMRPGNFDAIIANDVLEHVPNLVALMTSCLALLRIGGVFKISVPYDLSYGAWQDPTHVRTFNDRSWLYYTDWFWYLGWRDARFVVDVMDHVLSPLGLSLRDRGGAIDEIARMPRAVDSMSVILRKVALTADDRASLSRWRDRKRDRKAALQSGSEVPQAAPFVPRALAESWDDARHKYCIYVATPEGYAHRQTFDDIADALSGGFAALGGSAPIVRRSGGLAGRTPIVLGAHLLTEAEAATLPQDAVIYNFEQVDTASPWMTPAYTAILRRYAVLDYSIPNTRSPKNAGIHHARHLPIRSMPVPLAPRTLGDHDIDVLFYGSINERRGRIIERLRARGLKVVHLFGVYGAERDGLIDRAKVVINLHFYEAAIFEAARVSHLLARGCCVVSEGRPDDPDTADLVGSLVLCPYDAIVDECLALIKDDEKRRSLSQRARAAIEKRSQAAILREAFT